ncbi:MAG: hypothetical protein COC05_04325 [Gammaproteobacteria bacterium]|nr:MAG: hypothetical protein COC05_04325 [Gammaproteobacteria bacterium]
MVIRVLIFIALLLISSTSFALTAQVDRSSLAQNETMILQLQSDGRQDLSGLDLSQLRKDFEVTGRSTQSSINITNGEKKSNTVLTLSLKPLRAGDLHIPEFELDGKKSRAINVFVTEPLQVDSATQDRAVFMETEFDKTEVMVGEQLLFTLRILYATELSNASLPEFQLDGVGTEELPEQRYQRTIDGKRYGVIERRYALFPDKEGELTIPQQELNATIGGGMNRFGFSIENFGQGSQQIRVASDELSITVQSIPDGQSRGDWLPANQLTLIESWGSDPGKIRVGEPLLRKIQLTVEGVPAARLPEIRLADISGINIYPEKPELNSESTDKGVTGQRTETIALIPTQQGNYTLPKVSVKWWDTKNKRFQTAELPEKTLTILPAISNGAPIIDLPLLGNQSSLNEGNVSAKINGNGVQTWWQYLALFSTLAWLLTLAYLWATKNQRSQQPMAPTEEVNPTLRHAYHELKKQCFSNDAASTKASLEKWLALRFPELGNGALSEKVARLNDAVLTEQVNHLNNCLYGVGSSAEWQGANLAKVIDQLDKRKNDKKRDGLAPLYPIIHANR